MKKIRLSSGALIALSSLGFAGGDIAPVEAEVMAPVAMQSDNSGIYIGFGASAISARDSSLSLDFVAQEPGQDRLANATFLLGYNLNEYFAVEGRYTTTFSNADVVEVDGASFFVKPQYPLNEDFFVYALLGYGSVQLDGVGGASEIVDVDDSGFQWGLGASYTIDDSYTIFLDYTSLAYDMDGIYYNGALQVDVDLVTLGVTYKF